MSRSSEGRLRIAVDIGGTFVDAVEFDETSGGIRIHKASTTPRRPSTGVLQAVSELVPDLAAVDTFIHGMTLGLNAILQRNGARTAILTNESFRDIYEIGRSDVPTSDMYNFTYVRRPSIVPRRLTAGVRGRIDYRGQVVEELDEAGVIEAGRALIEEGGAESLAVVFLHSYANPEHERRAAELLRARYPHVTVSVSSDVVREYREYERTSTTVLDAYIKPLFERYIDELEQELRVGGLEGAFLITRSGGGAMTASVAKKAPLLSVLSGPAGGIIGASHIGNLIGRRNLISYDVGGTSLDACVILDGNPTEVYEAEIEHMPLLIPIYDIRTIGAGGGSIAWIDDGLLKVGPQSAGAEPGPMCYGRGGEEPTVTDAAICLGYISAEDFLDGRMAIDEEAAREGVRAKVGARLGIDLVAAAAAVFDVMLSRTVGAIREITVERGMDPREFSLLAFGGGGPMTAPMLMREMDLREIVIPNAPSAFSAWGMLMADLEFDFSRTVLRPLNSEELARLEVQFADMEAAAGRVLSEQGVVPALQTLERRLDLRYVGQEHTLAVDVSGATSSDVVRNRFELAHADRYGHTMTAAVQIVNLRLHAIGKTEKPTLQKLGVKGPGAEPESRRMAFDFASRELREFTVYRRALLSSGDRIDGPAIVNEGSCTAVIHSDQTLTVDEYGHFLVTRSED